MADVFSNKKRSEVMSRIRGKDTGIELMVRRWLHSRGYRFRKNVRDVPGSPDVAIKKYKVAIFVNGCFWHGHENCKLSTIPKSNVDFWRDKIERNQSRDRRNYAELESRGWHVKVLWECGLKNDFEQEMQKLEAWLESIIR